MNIGTRLRQARTEAGLSQEQAGKVAGVSKQSISQIENGQTADPKASTLEPLSRRLGVSLQWLMTGRGPERVKEASNSGDRMFTEHDGDSALASHPVPLNPANLLEAERWMLLFERAEGVKFSGLQRMKKVAEVYADIVADGGQLSDERHAEYLRVLDEGLERRTGGHRDERGKGSDGGRAAIRRGKSA